MLPKNKLFFKITLILNILGLFVTPNLIGQKVPDNISLKIKDAIENNQEQELKNLISKYPESTDHLINQKLPGNWYPIHLALAKNKTEIAKYLIDLGADLEIRLTKDIDDKNFASLDPIEIVIKNKNMDQKLVEKLIQKQHFIAKKEKSEIIKKLNHYDRLIFATLDLPFIQFMKQFKNYGLTLKPNNQEILDAINRKNQDFINELLSLKENIDITDTNLFIKAIKNGQLETFKRLTQLSKIPIEDIRFSYEEYLDGPKKVAGTDWNRSYAVKATGFTLLHLAIWLNQLPIVKYLIETNSEILKKPAKLTIYSMITIGWERPPGPLPIGDEATEQFSFDTLRQAFGFARETNLNAIQFLNFYSKRYPKKFDQSLIDYLQKKEQALLPKGRYEIISAHYGSGDKMKDVTEILKKMYQDKAFTFEGGPVSMNNLFGDPTPGIRKNLIIKYKDPEGTEKTRTISENEPFSIP